MQRTLVAVLGGFLAAAAAGCAKKEAPAPQPPDVKVATVLQKDVPVYVEAIGQTRGSTEVEVRARVEGFIESVDFQEGHPVRKGQLLYTIDPQGLTALGGIEREREPAEDTRTVLGASFAQRESLRYLADGTGGFAVYNTNDLSESFDRILDDESLDGLRRGVVEAAEVHGVRLSIHQRARNRGNNEVLVHRRGDLAGEVVLARFEP